MSTELDTIYAGATLDYLVETLTNYPASSGWSLRLVLNPTAGGTVRIINSVASGDAHRLQATAAATTAWTTGSHSRQAWVIKGSEQYPVTDLFGSTQIQPGLNAAAGADTRSQAQIGLDNIRAMMLSLSGGAQASGGVKRYRIGGRELERYEMADLRALETQYIARIKGETLSAAVKAGRPNPMKFSVRMGRA